MTTLKNKLNGMLDDMYEEVKMTERSEKHAVLERYEKKVYELMTSDCGETKDTVSDESKDHE